MASSRDLAEARRVWQRLRARVRGIRPEIRDRAFVVVLCGVLLSPLMVTELGAPPLYLGLPTVFGRGVDEEGYLVLLNSAVHDLDFDLRDDYARVLAGQLQGGRAGAGRILDHHSTYWIGGQRYVFRELVDGDLRHWRRGPDGLLYPVFRPGYEALASSPERPAHPVGMAFLLFPVLWPIRDRPDLVEHVALFCAGLATVIGLLVLRSILRRFTSSAWTRNVALVAAFLGSPVWFHARTLYTEPFLVPLVLGAIALALPPRGGRRRELRALAAGACVGAAMLMKPNAILMLPFLALPWVWRGEGDAGPSTGSGRAHTGALRSLALLAVGPLLAGLLLLWLNWRLYGSPRQGPFDAEYGNPLVALYHYLFRFDRGILWFAPPLAFGAIGFAGLWRSHRLEAAVVLGSFASLVGLMLVWRHFNGGWCFGPRLIVPALPLLAVGLAEVLDAGWFRRSFLARFVFYDLLLYAVLMNGQAVSRYWITMTWTAAWKIFGDFLGVCLK